MAIGTGVAVLCGIRKAATWGTSIIVSHANSTGFRPLSWSVDETSEPLPDKSFNADAFDRAITFTGRYLIRGSFKIRAKFDGIGTLLALFFGTAGTPSGSNPYTHTIYRKNDMTGVFFTLVWYDGIKYHEVDSCKFDSLKVTCSAGRIVEYEFGWFGRLRSENTATNTNLALLVENTTIAEVQWLNSTITYQLAAFASSLAAFTPNDWELSFARPHSMDVAYTSELILEPMAGEMTCSGSLTVPHEATTIIAAAKSGAQYKAKLVHTSGATQHNLWIPSITWEKWGANPSDKGAISQKLNFRAEKAVSAPSTFSQTTPYVELINTRATDYLDATAAA